MLHKLEAINMGDTVTYQHEGTVHCGEVHGWRLSAGHEHHVIVSSTTHEHEVSLRSILSRERLQGAESGIVTF